MFCDSHPIELNASATPNAVSPVSVVLFSVASSTEALRASRLMSPTPINPASVVVMLLSTR